MIKRLINSIFKTKEKKLISLMSDTNNSPSSKQMGGNYCSDNC